MVIVPLVLNGAIGAELHVNFAVASRSSFGFYLSRAAVVVRMITALFWHGECCLALDPELENMTDSPPSNPNLHRLDRHDPDHPQHLAILS